MDQWSIGGGKAKELNEFLDAGQFQAIAFLEVTVSLLDFEVGSERSFTEPSGRMFFRNASYIATYLVCNALLVPFLPLRGFPTLSRAVKIPSTLSSYV